MGLRLFIVKSSQNTIQKTAVLKLYIIGFKVVLN